MNADKEYYCDCCKTPLRKYNIKGFSLSFLEDVVSDYFGYPFQDLISNNLKNEKFATIKRVCFAILCDFSSVSDTDIKNRYNLPISNIAQYIKIPKKENNSDYLKLKTILEKS